jgi:hypothetical protein
MGFVYILQSDATDRSLEVSEADPSSDQEFRWLEWADLVGQVRGSSPHGPTISSLRCIFYL